MDGRSPTIGTRLKFAGHRGTIRFIGEVDNTQGVWLGVEWDDPERGKHDGVKDGKRYFDCRVPNSGSFIRPTSSVCYGASFLQALKSKYVEAQHGDDSQETVLLGSSNGAIVVEAINLDKIRRKLSDLQNLRSASLDGELVANSEPSAEILDCCPRIRTLNLSETLIASWETVAEISAGLPILEHLALNRNRLAHCPLPSSASAFASLRELQLNGTLINWAQMQDITALMPKLESVELGYNGLNRLLPSRFASLAGSVVRSFNLDNNECRDWPHVCHALKGYNALDRVILASNGIDVIPPLKENDAPLCNLTSLSLAQNNLSKWLDIDRLSLWCPALETLSLIGNPIYEDPAFRRHARQFTIAIIPSLLVLDATLVSPKERIDSELFYLSYISSSTTLTTEGKSHEHPRWRQLLAKHDMVDISQGAVTSETLGERLMNINVHCCFAPPPKIPCNSFETPSLVPLRVLPNMSIHSFRLKIRKALKSPPSASIRIWLKMSDDSFVQMDGDQDLSWWGIENGSDVFVYVDPLSKES